MTDPFRSLTSGFTPLSITATVTPEPRVTDHAASTFSMPSTHCWLSLMPSAAAEPANSPLSCLLPHRGAGRAGQGGQRNHAERGQHGEARTPPLVQHPGAPGQCGGAGLAASVFATECATPSAMLVISSSE